MPRALIRRRRTAGRFGAFLSCTCCTLSIRSEAWLHVFVMLAVPVFDKPITLEAACLWLLICAHLRYSLLDEIVFDTFS